MKTELGTIHWIQSTGSMRGNYGIELIELIDPFRLMERGLFRIVALFEGQKKDQSLGMERRSTKNRLFFAKCPRCQKLKNFDEREVYRVEVET